MIRASAPSTSISPLRGIFMMLLGGALLTANDAVMKLLTEGYPPGQVMGLRGVAAFVPILLIAYRAGGMHTLRVRHVKAQVARAVCFVSASFLWISALPYLPLADMVAVTFSGPLLITALAPFFLGEHVGWRRWTAVVVGFCGILLIVKPTGDAFRIAILLPIVSIWGGVARDIITRRIAATESSVATLSFTTAGTALVGILTLPFGWSLPGGTDALLFLVGGFFFGTAHFCMIESLRLAEAAVVVPFRYFNVIWGALFGYMLWGDVPDAWIVSGISLVVVSGLYIMHRETSQRAVAAGPPTGPA